MSILEKLGGKGQDVVYYQKADFLSPAERFFFLALKKAINDQAVVFIKIQMSDLITPQTGIGKRKWQKAYKELATQRFDFVLCNPSTLSPVVAIELDDDPRQLPSERDATKITVCDSADLPLIRIIAREEYKTQTLQKMLANYFPAFAHLKPEPKKTTPAAAKPVEKETLGTKPAAPASETLILKDPVTSPQKPDTPRCPKCNAEMQIKTGQKGKYAGKQFWVCQQYPKCRGILPVKK